MKKQSPMKSKPQKKSLHRLPKIESVGYPRPLYGDVEGILFDIPGYRGLARKGKKVVPLEGKELIPLPQGSSLYSLPDRKPALWKKGEVEILPHPLTAVGAVLPDGYIFTGLPAFEKDEESKESLSPLPYAAMACWQNKNWAAAVQLVKRDPLELPQIRMFSTDSKMQSLVGLSLDVSFSEAPWELVILFCPGISDLPQEIQKWSDFLKLHPPASIRLENLSCDWDALLEKLPDIEQEPLGLEEFLSQLKKAAPEAQIDQIIPYWQGEKEGNR